MGLLEALIDRDTLNRMIEAHVELEQQLQQAHREGWEQAKAEAKLLSFSCSCYKAIAKMEYGGKEDV